VYGTPGVQKYFSAVSLKTLLRHFLVGVVHFFVSNQFVVDRPFFFHSSLSSPPKITARPSWLLVFQL